MTDPRARSASAATTYELPPIDADEQRWLSRIDPTRVPRHVAVIMDGNGRWARQQHLPRIVGHQRGAETTRLIIRACRHLPTRLAEAGVTVEPGLGRVEHLTLYTFSNENWSRPEDEVGGLMRLIEDQLHANLAEMLESEVSVRLLGRADDLPASLRRELERDVEATAANSRMRLYLALNYGGRREIVDAAREIAAAAQRGELDPAQLDEAAFAARLYAPDVPDPELLIRTGGDLRVSNFLLWQIAYAELWVTGTLWPAFRPVDVYRAIAEYQTRERRFGGLVSDATT
ncbi:MAG: di-trans,poly-cis-decaprenylcistransferase [Fimbriimonadaceae bacterium]|nr:di-trans,poly-cis-decaprenylcistransferase [Fimbriimonadaceae bacterium]